MMLDPVKTALLDIVQDKGERPEFRIHAAEVLVQIALIEPPTRIPAAA